MRSGRHSPIFMHVACPASLSLSLLEHKLNSTYKITTLTTPSPFLVSQVLYQTRKYLRLK